MSIWTAALLKKCKNENGIAYCFMDDETRMAIDKNKHIIEYLDTRTLWIKTQVIPFENQSLIFRIPPEWFPEDWDESQNQYDSTIKQKSPETCDNSSIRDLFCHGCGGGMECICKIKEKQKTTSSWVDIPVYEKRGILFAANDTIEKWISRLDVIGFVFKEENGMSIECYPRRMHKLKTCTIESCIAVRVKY